MGSSSSRPDSSAATSTIIPSPSCVPRPHYPAASLAANTPPLHLSTPPPNARTRMPSATDPLSTSTAAPTPISTLPEVSVKSPKSSLSRQEMDPATRTRRQAGLFFGGAAFVVFSTLVTRRSLARRNNTIVNAVANAAKTTGAGATPGKVGGANPAAPEAAKAEAEAALNSLNNSGPVLALEALTVATLNVFSWAIMATGGVLWYFDIASMDDMKRAIRGGLGVDGTGRTEEEAEEEMEEWLATVLSRKDEKRKREEEDRKERDRKDREEFEEFQRFKNERGRAR